MFITKGIVDLHKGEIHVFSKGEGTGCTFIVDLPMTRKIEPIAVPNHMRRRSTRDRLVGLLGRQNSHRPSTTSPAIVPAPQNANLPAAVFHSLPLINPRPSHTFHQRPSHRLNQLLTSPLATDEPISLNNHTSGARIDSNLPNQEGVRSGGPVASIGRHSFNELAEYDMTMTSAVRQAEATALQHKESTDCCSNSARGPEGGNASGSASGGGPTISPPPPRGEHTQDDDVVAVGSDHAADAPLQQLRPAAMTTVASSPAPAQESAALLLAPALPPSAAPSRKSQKRSQNGQIPPQGPVYHVLVVDDSTMTRKMLMKTLRNEGITHPLKTL